VYQVESFQSTKLSDETPGKYVYYNRLPGYVLLRCADQELLFQRLVDEGILYKSWRSKVKRIEKKEVVQMLSWEFDKLKNFLESQIIPDGKKQEIDFAVGDSVMILSGPLQNVVLTIEEIYPEMKKVKMLTTFFGRYTPVEVSFDNLKKVKQY
jgi:transcriptional antiterminator NusG